MQSSLQTIEDRTCWDWVKGRHKSKDLASHSRDQIQDVKKELEINSARRRRKSEAKKREERKVETREIKVWLNNNFSLLTRIQGAVLPALIAAKGSIVKKAFRSTVARHKGLVVKMVSCSFFILNFLYFISRCDCQLPIAERLRPRVGRVLSKSAKSSSRAILPAVHDFRSRGFLWGKMIAFEVLPRVGCFSSILRRQGENPRD